MIANCDALVTQYSSTVFVGLALGKECHSYWDLDELRRLMPVQNASARPPHRPGLRRGPRRGARGRRARRASATSPSPERRRS